MTLMYFKDLLSWTIQARSKEQYILKDIFFDDTDHSITDFVIIENKTLFSKVYRITPDMVYLENINRRRLFLNASISEIIKASAERKEVPISETYQNLYFQRNSLFMKEKASFLGEYPYFEREPSDRWPPSYDDFTPSRQSRVSNLSPAIVNEIEQQHMRSINEVRPYIIKDDTSYVNGRIKDLLINIEDWKIFGYEIKQGYLFNTQSIFLDPSWIKGISYNSQKISLFSLKERNRIIKEREKRDRQIDYLNKEERATTSA